MNIPLRMLNVEDSEDDSLLLVRHLSRAGYDVTATRVDTPEEMQAALTDDRWDVVVADYAMPGFSAPKALALLREQRSDVPVVIISGIVSDDVMAVGSMHGGVWDCLDKTYLARLVSAIALAAGVIAEADRPSAHLVLCHEYLHLPEPNLAKAASHGELALSGAEAVGLPAVAALAVIYLEACYSQLGWEERAADIMQRFEGARQQISPREAILAGDVLVQLGLAMEQSGDRDGAAGTYDLALDWFREMDLTDKMHEVSALADRLHTPVDADVQWSAPDGDDFAAQLSRGAYYLLSGDAGRAVREALSALQTAGMDFERCYQCYCLLMRCALYQAQYKDAINFAISGRIMALEAQRYDLAFQVAQAFDELCRALGPRAEGLLAELNGEYRKLGMDLSQFLPD